MSGLEPILLWTDALVFVLVAVIAGFAFLVSRREHLRAPWRRVAVDPVGMAAAVVLSAFVVVGLLDSLHFRAALPGKAGARTQYAPEVLSVLDVLAGPLRMNVEKTYSAPLATRLYAKETVEGPGGRTTREFPRLKFGGAHLPDPDLNAAAVIRQHPLTGLVEGVIATAMVMVLAGAWLARRRSVGVADALGRMLAGDDAIPWRATLSVAGAMLVFLFVAIEVAPRYHLFGTDKVGQDVFYAAIKSVRTGLVIGTLTTLVMLPFALLLGMVAGYFRGWADDIIQYLYTTLNSIPGVLLIASAVLLMQGYIERNPEMFDTAAARADFRLLFLCMILGVTSWTGLCRLLRAETLKLRELDYIEAARAFGVRPRSIMTRHLLPNLGHIVLITVVIDFSGLVLAEAVLSYVGVGVDPTMQSWGNMINSARLEMAREPVVWWQLGAAFAFMFALVLAANLFADAVRDAFDPRRRAYP